MTAGGPRRTQTTAKSFRLLEVLNEHEEAGISELANTLDISKSTVHTHLNTLVDCGYVIKHGDEYRIGLRFLELGGHARSRMDLYKHAKFIILETVEHSHEEALLVTREDDDGVVLFSSGRRSDSEGWYAGRRFTLTDIPSGEVMLASLPEERAREIVESIGEDPSAVRDRATTIRSQGYASGRRNGQGEIHHVAAPVRVDDRVVAAVGLIERRDVDLAHSVDETIDRVQSIASRIELDMDQPWYGSEEVISPKHSLSAYLPRSNTDRHDVDR